MDPFGDFGDVKFAITSRLSTGTAGSEIGEANGPTEYLRGFTNRDGECCTAGAE